MLRLAPSLTVALFLAPIAAGLIGTLLPAFGYFPSIGGNALSLQPWRDLAAYPGLLTSLRLTVTIGTAATLVSVLLASGFCALAHDRPFFRRLERFLAPLLATPHAAVAIGFAFLIAPSGWLARLVSPWLTGWQLPPPIVTTQDPLGLAVAAGLVVKEMPYLVLVLIGATTQVAARPMIASARAMGYDRLTAWLKIVLPQVYPQIRLPVYAVLAFSLSMVDVALILGPGNPPPLSVLAARWFADYDLRLYYPAAAAAVLLLALVIAAILLWRLLEIAVARLGRRWIERGERSGPGRPLMATAGTAAVAVGALGLLSLLSMAVWSVAASWRFPEALPARWTEATWVAHVDAVWPPLRATIIVGLASSLVAVALALACLENEQRRGIRPGASALLLLYVPLLVPQIAFLFGPEVLLVRLRLDGSWIALIWTHLLFVLPYVFLSLADPWRALDQRYARAAAGLGAPPLRTFLCVKLPMLLRSLLIAVAVGFAVSVAQYLPTIFAGAGRIATLTTEAVTLAGGSDRRIVGVYAFLQSAMPLLVYGTALAVPALLYRRRRGLS
jgi:putative thiamine transport system permease protein